jgi:hypoxanthine phosphoribosyltransferase
MTPAEEPVPSAPSFAHASEAELARILDFYDVRWVYEPHTFPILWSLDGAVIESFSPDFFLPDLDLYIELTTLKQSLVRKKNRKLRRLRELYPDIRIKLFYARDFRQLMLKFGRVALVDALSGTSGQVVPERLDARAPDDPLPLGTPASAATADPEPAIASTGHDDGEAPAAPHSADLPAEDRVPTVATTRRNARRRRRRRPARTADAIAPPR